MTLSASGLPAGATATSEIYTLSLHDALPISISTVTSTPVGSYTLTVTGTGASATHSTSVSLTVTVPDDFSISASPSSVTVVQGQSVTSAGSTTGLSSSDSPMTLAAFCLHAEATASFNPSTVT